VRKLVDRVVFFSAELYLLPLVLWTLLALFFAGWAGYQVRLQQDTRELKSVIFVPVERVEPDPVDHSDRSEDISFSGNERRYFFKEVP